MLSELIVENVAVIERAEINFTEGFNVFTGETGAGKSILVDAIYAVLGARTSKNIVRTGTDKATVTAVFTDISPEAVKILKEMGLGSGEDCILRREIGADGKTASRINDRPVTQSSLRAVSEVLMSIYGQNDSHDLLSPKTHLFMIDAYGSLSEKREALKAVHTEFIKVKKELDSLKAKREETARMRELYEFQVKEIEEADLSEEEENELKNRQSILKNSEKLLRQLSLATDLLYNDQSPVEAVKSVSDGIALVAGSDEELNSIAARLSDAYYEINDCLRSAERYAESFEMSENELSEIEDRLYKIQVLNRKYGPDVAGTLSYLSEIKESLKSLYEGDELEDELAVKADKTLKELKKMADELSEKRKKAAEKFLSEVTAALADLNMKNVRMETVFREKNLGSGGKDEVEFLISVNPGEEPKALSKIASGGENSRIMLAIKSVLSDKDAIDSMIFDEIDTGVSGSGATKIGEKLSSLSKSKQIICITHQAQIAAMADTHFHIEKNTRDGRTYTTVTNITGEKRAEELARIMGGDKYSKALMDSAREMLGNLKE